MQGLSDTLIWIVDQQFGPAWASLWLKSFANHPTLFVFRNHSTLVVFQKELSIKRSDFCACGICVAARLRLDMAERPKKPKISKPKGIWTDSIVRRLRTNLILVAIYDWLTGRVVPMLLALFIAVPVGLLLAGLYPQILPQRLPAVVEV